ncbi:glycogen debranching enzyme GlgX [Thioclava sp. SK-1]|uniref:glycogen debranching protein GlgX n=1 Tax=Thioclava sp. SK-1 TaxID=1889770 RepID=UPI000826E641|nr:glycogen debranching protein GlgX [Thioclava sp. SK-1]OCX62267.1 glycogen debranching enzyme GlgX [Thioclava sp. SK-1]
MLKPGDPTHLGATPRGDGVNFALFSAHAEKVELCLLTNGKEERFTLPSREGDVWSGFMPGLTVGAQYGYRVHGPWAPEIGHRFNTQKLLIDPYAREINSVLRWHKAMQGGVSRPDRRDSRQHVPHSVVRETSHQIWDRPDHSWSQTVIYEAHVKGISQRHPGVSDDERGRFAGAASDAILDHLQKLGVTAIELLPCCSFIDDRFLVEKDRVNYWGYQPIANFAPDPRYGTPDEFQAMVRRFHGAGIEVILDVVFNHTGEGDGAGPMLSMKGIDNAAYYRLSENGRTYVNDTGTGNTLNVSHPFGLRLVLDCLRYWVTQMGVDGFRFDLASTLARGRRGHVEHDSSFLNAIRQDPVLCGVKLIAEPWDIGPGGYFLGGFPHPFREWNDRYRDSMRRFWRKDHGQRPELARCLAGSADTFDHSGRPSTSSLNFLTAHDGFTLHDLVSYNEKRNEANGESNRDGHNANYSQALRTDEERGARKRALMSSLLLSQGVPMILGGDEFGNSQGGNNNAYCQDNDIGWLNWPEADQTMIDFVARLIALRNAHPVLRQALFLHAKTRWQDGQRDLIWRGPSGAELSAQDWNDHGALCLCAEIRGAAEGTSGLAGHEAFFAIFNAGDTIEVQLPKGFWIHALDSALPMKPEEDHFSSMTCVSAQSVQLFTRPTVQQE